MLPMSMFNSHRQIGVVASLAASVLILGGCRGTAVKSAPAYSSGTSGPGTAPFYRSYNKDNYDEGGEEPAQPFPGQGDQIAPLPPIESAPGPDIPPSPSAQRLRWNGIRNGAKSPAMTRNQHDVSQTAGKYDRRSNSLNVTKPAASSSRNVVSEEIVQPRSTGISSQDSTSGPFHSAHDDHGSAPPLLLPPDR